MSQGYCWGFEFAFKFAGHLCLPNVSRNVVESSSAVCSEAFLIFINFREGRASKITTSGVIAMEFEKVGVPQ